MFGFCRRRVTGEEIAEHARALASRVPGPCPEAVVYIERGGRRAGQTMAAALGVPLLALDIGYPFSRAPLVKGPRMSAVLFLLKELLYRLTSPRAHLRNAAFGRLGTAQRIVLVDDTASSGRTLRAAVASLENAGIARHRLWIAVVRCGARARALVDDFALSERVLFERD